VLVVGDPKLDAAANRRLPSLPGALREANAVAGLYGKAVLLTGPAATKTRFLQALASSTILHFAGHVEVKQDSFVETALHLATDSADPHDDSRVTLNDLSGTRMGKLDLAILSGCDTARAVGENREDLGGLAAVFLARGVRNVVATLAPVSDGWAPEFMRGFHARILAGEAPPSAFRQSVLKEIDRDQRIAPQWVNYVIFGGLNDEL
jgi:CHAT domain-containing protein